VGKGIAGSKPQQSSLASGRRKFTRSPLGKKLHDHWRYEKDLSIFFSAFFVPVESLD
jgi:hypothetical protein